MHKFFKLLTVFAFSISVLGISQQNVFAEDDSIEFKLSEQKKIAEEIRDKLFLTSDNPYGDISITPLIDEINSNVNYVEIGNFKTNDIKLEQANLAEITLYQILGYKQIHPEIEDDIKNTDDEITKKSSIESIDSNQLYLQEHISNMEKIRDDVLFKSSTTIPNPYEKDLKTIQEYDQITKNNVAYSMINNTVDNDQDIFDDALSNQENLAEITMHQILGYKQIHNPVFEKIHYVESELIEPAISEFEKPLDRSDESFETYRLKQTESSEILRNQIFEIYHKSDNPYLEYGGNLAVITKVAETLTAENYDILNRDDPIFELKKLLESDRAEELRIKLTGIIYDETFHDDYFEVIDD